jgi:molecular chaperone DnaK
MGSFHRVIGIDLGTTFSVVASYNFDKQDIKVIPNRQNEPTTPSVVYISPSGEVSVGKAAKAKQARDPDGVLFEVKRIMGEWNEDGSKKMAIVGGKAYDPEHISAYILKELKSNAERLIGEPIHDVVITVPAYFKEPQKNATLEAAKIAKLNPRRIINEPTAAALAYGLESDEVETFIVYDFGGGTFDVSIVRVESQDTVEVLGTGGNAHLGGGDIDQLLIDWVLDKMKAEFGRDFTDDKKLLGRLRLAAEEVKINLCNEGSSQEFSLVHPAADIDEASYTISLREFERMIQPILEKTFREVDVALGSAAKNNDITMDDIEAFILVGGSSKIPAVNRLLQERYRKPIKANLNPDEIVAIGAARMAQNFEPSTGAQIKDDAPLEIDRTAVDAKEIINTNIKDVVSHTLGVGLVDDVYDSLISKDSVIPNRVQRRGYTTAEDYQTSIYVPVYQGDAKKASMNAKLGELVIQNITPEPKGIMSSKSHSPLMPMVFSTEQLRTCAQAKQTASNWIVVKVR